MKRAQKRTLVTFAHTSRAVGRIKQPSIRKDFAEMLRGLEFCCANGQRRVALKCTHALVAMTIGLNRTITPRVAVGILDGLLEDGKHDPLFRRAGGLVDTHDDQRCVIGTGTTIGTCQPKDRMTCYTISGVEGCGSLSGFTLPWTGALVAAKAR